METKTTLSFDQHRILDLEDRLLRVTEAAKDAVRAHRWVEETPGDSMTYGDVLHRRTLAIARLDKVAKERPMTEEVTIYRERLESHKKAISDAIAALRDLESEVEAGE